MKSQREAEFEPGLQTRSVRQYENRRSFLSSQQATLLVNIEPPRLPS